MMMKNQDVVDEIECKKILHWNYRNLNEFPEELRFYGKHINEIYMKENKICQLPLWLVEMNNLSALHLFKNKIEYLPDEIGLLIGLEELDLANNCLKIIPNSLYTLKNLQILDLQCNYIEELSEEIENMVCLSKLYLKQNLLKRIPNSITKLNSLTELILDYNQLNHIPSNIVYLPNLSFLSLCCNNIKYLPSLNFISNPHLKFTDNPLLNYISYDIGKYLTRRNISNRSEIFDWFFDISGCSTSEILDQDYPNNIIIAVEDFKTNLLISSRVKYVAAANDRFIPSLLEMTLRILYEILYNIDDYYRIASCPSLLTNLTNSVKIEFELVATTALSCEKVWLNKSQYALAEKLYFEKRAKCGQTVVNDGLNSLAGEVAKARQHIKSSLEYIDDSNVTKKNSVNVNDQTDRLQRLEIENSDLKKSVQSLTALMKTLEIRICQLEKTCTAGPSNKTTQESSSSKINTAKDDNDDDLDLFDGDSEEEDAEAKKVKELRLAEYAAKKSKKPALIQKSNIIFDIKPWDDETDMKKMEVEVRKISMDGLLWGTSKLVPVAFGLKKLQISSVVEDEKVSVDDLQEQIEQIEDLVQSVDIAAFNKV